MSKFNMLNTILIKDIQMCDCWKENISTISRIWASHYVYQHIYYITQLFICMMILQVNNLEHFFLRKIIIIYIRWHSLREIRQCHFYHSPLYAPRFLSFPPIGPLRFLSSCHTWLSTNLQFTNLQHNNQIFILIALILRFINF